MEYQNIIINNKQNQPSKFRRKIWMEINNHSRGTYNINNQIRFKVTFNLL